MAYQPEGLGKTWGECRTCGFFEEQRRDETGYAHGECRRHAPMPFLVARNDDIPPRRMAIWPEVDELDGCGEYEFFEDEEGQKK